MAGRGIYIGTAGWMYKDWHETFYPEEAKRGYLSYYSSRFSSVEINNTFYRLPSIASFKKWYGETPGEFVFSVKLSRYITHIKRLRGIKKSLRRFIGRVLYLREKRGPILVQLPPNFAFSPDRLAYFFRCARDIREGLLFAFEPRHPSWFEQTNIAAIRPLLKEYKAAFVFANSSRFKAYPPKPENMTAPFMYVRLHGPREFSASAYKKEGLLPWVHAVRALQGSRDVFMYFNNDVHGYAIADAALFHQMLRDS